MPPASPSRHETLLSPTGSLTRRSSRDAFPPPRTKLATLRHSTKSRRRTVPRPKGLPGSPLVWGLMGAAGVALVVCRLLACTHKPDPVLLHDQSLALPRAQKGYSNNTLTTWDFASHDIVQVIQTRFMQFQPHLAALGEARLNIFETFCLPSMLAQSSTKFLWLIRTDPLLTTILRDRLIDLLKEYPNILLIASNANPEGFRSVQDIEPNSVWSGSYELLRRYHVAAQSRVVVESRLDADDGLHFGFVEFAELLTQEELVSTETDWLIYCAYSHLEWHHANPFQTKGVKETAYGFVVGTTQTSCITAGLSYVYGLEVKRDSMPKGAHSQLHRTTPFCSNSIKRSCIRRTKELIPTAIRARTPTSAGMANVVVTGSGGDKNLDHLPPESAATFQDDIWRGVNHAFGIERDKVTETRTSLESHLPEIVRENLKGQCTKGHSCKPTSKVVLKQLLRSLPTTATNRRNR